MKLHELFDNPYKVQWDDSDPRDINATFKTAQGNTILVTFSQEIQRYDLWDISFQIEFKSDKGFPQRTFNISNTGDAPRVFATVIAVMVDFMTSKQPDYVYFSSKVSEPSRIKLYDAMVRKAVNTVGKYHQVDDLTEIPEEVANYVNNQDQYGLKGWLFTS
jgi:hypothetical protein